MMINKRLIRMVPESKAAIRGQVLFQWGSLTANIVILFTFSFLLERLWKHQLSSAQLGLAGVLIASYWVVDGGRKENFEIRSGVSAAGLLSFLAGAVFACITGGTFASFPGLIEAVPVLNLPFFVGPINGIVLSFLLYIVLARLLPEKKAA